MLKMFLSSLLILFSFIMMLLNHPLSLGLLILIQTFILCLLSGMMIYSYWFSYILFLTFLGGLLILFIYTSSVASNEIFNFSFNFKLISMMLFIMFFFMFFFIYFWYNHFFVLNNMFNLEMNNLFNMYLFMNMENNINLSKLYNEQTYFLMIMLIIYLFITLIAVVKITNIFFGPLRSFN